MELRDALLPPPVSPARVAELSARIRRIEDLMRGGALDAAREAAAALGEATGHPYTAEDFAEYYGWTGLAELAVRLARPARPKVPDVTRAELVEIVRRVQAAGSGRAAPPASASGASQPSADAGGSAPVAVVDFDYYLLLLDVNVAHPRASGLVTHPPAELANASPEELVDAMLAYRPIAL